MKRLSVVILGMALAGQLAAQEYKIVEKSYKAFKTIRMETVSGDVEVVKGQSDQILVKVRYWVEPKGAFEPRFDEGASQLRLEEEWSGRSRRSEVFWTLTVPEETEIRFSTASGDFRSSGLAFDLDASTASGDIELSEVKGEFDLNTASGDIAVENGEGRFKLSTASGEIKLDGIKGEIKSSTASGDIELDRCQGEIECSAASGDVEAGGLSPEGLATFSTASGDVLIRLSAPLKEDLELSTASGSVTLDFCGQPIAGLFILTAREDRGRITAPFEFDSEETFERYDQVYVRKTAKVKGDTPEIRMSTASGRAIIKQ